MLYEIKCNSRISALSSERLHIGQQVAVKTSDNDILIGSVSQELNTQYPNLIGNEVVYSYLNDDIANDIKRTSYLMAVKAVDDFSGQAEYVYVPRASIIEENDILICVDLTGMLYKYKVLSSKSPCEYNTPTKIAKFCFSTTERNNDRDWCKPKNVRVGDTVYYSKNDSQTIMSISEVNSVLKRVAAGKVLYIQGSEGNLKYFKCNNFKKYTLTGAQVGDTLLIYDLSEKIFKIITIHKSISNKYYVDLKYMYSSLNGLLNELIPNVYVIEHIDAAGDKIFERLPGVDLIGKRL
jgi:hypothetical protein